MVQPVQHSFEFAGYIAPLPMFQAPLVSQPRTCELSNLAAYANIDYQHKIPMEFEFSQEFIAHTSGEVNALRFITQNVITVSEAEQKAITWPNQCLVLPIAEPFLVEHGHAIEVAFKYPAGGSIQQLSDSIELAHRTH